MAPAIAERVATLGTRPSTLVEPFAGGAGMSLALLGAGVVDRAILADGDPLVGAFWDVVTDPAGARALSRWALAQHPTVAGWDLWRAKVPATQMEAARKALFLSRTSFSGVLHGEAGPIGGRSQAGEHRIDSRWGHQALARKIEAVGALGAADRLISWGTMDWAETLARASEVPGAVVYADPPYAGVSELYRREFTADDHAALAGALAELPVPWILSYDDDPLVRRLYAVNPITAVEHTYSTSGRRGRNPVGRELLIEPAPAERLLAAG